MEKSRISRHMLALFLCLIMLPSLAAGIDIVTSDSYADLSVAQLLGAKISGNVVKLGWGENAKTAAEALAGNKIYVIGGTSALPAFAESTAPRIIASFQGKDRYETASLAASVWNSSESIAVAYGYDEEGIENAKSFALAKNAPLLFVSQTELTAPTENAIEALKPKKAFLVPSPDMIQNYIIASLKSRGIEVEITSQNHNAKTSRLIEKAKAAIESSKSLQGNSAEAVKLIAEAERELSTALDYFNTSMYNYAFEHGTLALYRAETAEKIKKGIIKVPPTAIPAEGEEKALNETLMAPAIADILLNPEQFKEKKIRLSGKIEEAVEIKSSAYLTIFDGTGRLIVTFNSTKEFILSKGWLFLVEQNIAGKEIEVEGTFKINVPISSHGEPSQEHSAFAYLIYAENMRMKR